MASILSNMETTDEVDVFPDGMILRQHGGELSDGTKVPGYNHPDTIRWIFGAFHDPNPHADGRPDHVPDTAPHSLALPDPADYDVDANGPLDQTDADDLRAALPDKFWRAEHDRWRSQGVY